MRIRHYFSTMSPFAYLAGDRLERIAAARGAVIDHRPADFAAIFAEVGGLPVHKRHPSRQEYRLQELARWRDHLGVPLVLQPRHFPPPVERAMQLLVGAQHAGGADAGFALAGAMMRAVWAEERDIGDDDTLVALADAAGLDGRALLADAPAHQAEIERNTQQAIDAQVFGSPWYRIGTHDFWGQDRLEFVERALAAA